jgi:hypothetical protein
MIERNTAAKTMERLLRSKSYTPKRSGSGASVCIYLRTKTGNQICGLYSAGRIQWSSDAIGRTAQAFNRQGALRLTFGRDHALLTRVK